MMFAVIETSTGKAVHLLTSEPVITEVGMISPIKALDVKSATHSFVEIDEPTTPFMPGMMVVTEGVWSTPDEAVYLSAIAPSTGLINLERERRVLAGGTFSGIPVIGDDQTITNLTNLAFGASLRIGAGDTTTITVYRDAVNNHHDLTPAQVLGLWNASTSYIKLLYQKSWDLKAMDPIPYDYTDDSYWT